MTRLVCRTVAIDLRAKVIGAPDSEQRTTSLQAACALQMMSDRNFNLAPAKVKADCRAALDHCER